MERLKASVRAKVEHPFRLIKRQFGYVKVRYRGIAKNAAQVLTLFALSTLWMSRRRLLAAGGGVKCARWTGKPGWRRGKRWNSERIDGISAFDARKSLGLTDCSDPP